MLIRDTLRYLPAQVLSPLAQLVSMVAWTHWLAPAQLGAFTLVAATQEAVYLVGLSWFSAYVLRSLPGSGAGDDWRRRCLQTESGVVLLACAALMLAGFAFAPLAAGDGPLWQHALAIGAFFATRAANAHYAERARAQSAFAVYTLLQVVGPLLGLVLGALALQFVAPTAVVLWASYALAHAIGVAVALPALGIASSLRGLDREVLRAAWRFGGPMLGLSALGWVAENHLRYLVQWQSGAVALGLMATGWGLGRRCASVAAMLVTTAAFPLAARLLNQGRRDEAVTQLGVNAALLMGVMLPVATGLAFIGPALVELAVAPAYREATESVLALAVMSGAVRCLHVHVTDQWLVLDRRFAIAAWIDVVEIAACGLASVAGLAFFGLRGAVAGQLVGSAVALAFSCWWATARLGFRWPWRDTVKVVAASAAMGLVLASIGTPPNAAGIATGIVVGALVYAIALGACHAGSLRLRR